jgi:hypothetical protein
MQVRNSQPAAARGTAIPQAAKVSKMAFTLTHPLGYLYPLVLQGSKAQIIPPRTLILILQSTTA